MKMRKHYEPAHTEYSITMVRSNGQRDVFYNGYVYRTREQAQMSADSINERRNQAKYGRAEVSERLVEGQHTLVGTLRL